MNWVSILLLLLTATPLAAQCSLEVGAISDLKGAWVDLTHNHTVVKHEVVCADSKLQRKTDPSPSPTDFLKISVRSDSRQTLTFECRVLLGCETPLDLTALINEEKRRLSGSSFLESFESWRNSRDRATTVISHFHDQPPTSPVLKTIVMEAGKRIPAIDAFRAGAPLGKYSLDFCTEATDDGCERRATVPNGFSWKPGASSVLPFPPVPAGVYLLYRLNDYDSALRTNDRVFVIAVPHSRTDVAGEARDKIAIAELSVSTDEYQDFDDYVRYIGVRVNER